MNEKGIKVLKALANNRRVAIVEELRKGSLDVSDLSWKIGLSYKSMSKHLQKLTEAGIIKRDPQGKNVYHLIDKRAEKLFRQIENYLKKK